LIEELVFADRRSVITGLGCGLATVTCPLFIAEIAPASMKKAMGISNQLFIVLGMLLGQSLSFPFAHPYRWRWVLVASISLATLQLAGSVFVRQEPEHKSDEARGGDEETPLLSDGESTDE
jgi:MFS family permease